MMFIYHENQYLFEISSHSLNFDVYAYVCIACSLYYVGTYHCVARNSVGESTSREAHMTVREMSSNNDVEQRKVQIEQQTTASAATHMFYDEEDDYVMMLCPMDGLAKREIVWMHNDQIISDITGHIDTHVNGTIIIHNPVEEDEGNYRCEATNSFGDVTTIANYDLIGN